jgi:DNA repair exonuclease SbcCD ATPase subunit
MNFTRLEVVNFKRIRTVEIKPDGSVVHLRGNNGQGKSSVLDAIAALLGGAKMCPAEPIRRGEKEAVIHGRVDSYEDFGSILLERHFRLGEDGNISSSLKITSEQGVKLDRPQRRVDELVGSLSFDPLAFLRHDAHKQAEIVRGVAGVDMTTFDARREKVYEQRTDVNRRVTAGKALVAGLPLVVAPDEEVSAAVLLEEQNRRQEIAAENERKRAALRRAGEDYNAAKLGLVAAKEEVERLEAELEEARDRLADKVASLDRIRETGVKLKEEASALVDPDMTEIVEQLKDIEQTNRRVRAKKERATAADDLAAAEKEAAALTAEIDQIDEDKRKALAEAHLPVPGLSFTECGVILNGLPFEQASQAEQLQVSVAMAIALNPDLKVMLIRDGSLLDKASLALLAEMAEAAGAQVWIEMVGKDGAGIVIEDGQIETGAA